MKITIINQPSKNRGDEAAHRSLMRTLNKEIPEEQINVVFVGENPNTVEQMQVENPNNRYFNINISSNIKKKLYYRLPKRLVKYNLMGLSKLFSVYREFIHIIKNSDVVICAPGGICMGGFKNWGHLLYLLLTLKYNKNLLYYSRSIGPFSETTKDNKIFKKVSLNILRSFKFISLRDAKSIQTAEQIGIDSVHSIDTAFLDVPKVDKLPKELDAIINTDYIVFVPNSLTWHHTYSNAKQGIIDDFFISIANYILKMDSNLKIVMLPQLFNDTRKPDEIYFQNLKSKIDSDRIIALPETYSSDIQQKLISKSKMVIGARYHSVVFAINNNVPFVALSYEHKIAGLLDILNMSDRCVDISSIGTDYKHDEEILKQVIEKINNPIESEVLIEAQNKAQKIAQDCFFEALKVIKTLKR